MQGFQHIMISSSISSNNKIQFIIFIVLTSNCIYYCYHIIYSGKRTFDSELCLETSGKTRLCYQYCGYLKRRQPWFLNPEKNKKQRENSSAIISYYGCHHQQKPILAISILHICIYVSQGFLCVCACVFVCYSYKSFSKHGKIRVSK